MFTSRSFRLGAASGLLCLSTLALAHGPGHGSGPVPKPVTFSAADARSLASMPLAARIRTMLQKRSPPVPLTLASDADLARAHAAGYFRSHGWTTFAGQGLALAATAPTALQPETPALLLYRPVPPGHLKPDSVLSDQRPDYPYELVGVGWFAEYKGRASLDLLPSEAPPSMPIIPDGILPNGGWFRHAAGCHIPSGHFVPFQDNLPAPDLPAPLRMALGTSWCADIGANATWKPTSTPAVPGAPGECVLSRLSHSPLCPLKHEHPGDCQMSRQEVRYVASLLRPIPDGLTVGWNAPASAPATDVTAAANESCRTMGTQLVADQAPVMWHGAYWDTHAFFNEDGSLSVGIEDPQRVPHGLRAPQKSFVPPSPVLHRVGP